jgi:hypothetical protein
LFQQNVKDVLGILDCIHRVNGSPGWKLEPEMERFAYGGATLTLSAEDTAETTLGFVAERACAVTEYVPVDDQAREALTVPTGNHPLFEPSPQ